MHYAVSAFAVLILSSFLLADDPKPISTDDAAKMVDKKVTVEMEVKSTGVASRNGMVFLNSMMNRNDGKNFVVVLRKDLAEKLKKTLNAEPKDHYKGKTIQVTGTVTLYMNRPQIEVSEPEQVKVVEKK
jgi:DNA/RNA endonuclease YhcR with UshA esterase domain